MFGKKYINNNRWGGEIRSGNWYASQHTWSRSARFELANSNNWVGEPSEKLRTVSAGLSYHLGEESPRVDALAEALVAGIYRLPEEALQYIYAAETVKDAVGQDLYALTKGVFDTNIYWGRDLVTGDSVLVNRHIYCTDQEVGMPVAKFLLLYCSGDISDDTLAEWSGIPSRYIQTAYDGICAIMWRELGEIRAEEHNRRPGWIDLIGGKRQENSMDPLDDPADDPERIVRSLWGEPAESEPELEATDDDPEVFANVVGAARRPTLRKPEPVHHSAEATTQVTHEAEWPDDNPAAE